MSDDSLALILYIFFTWPLSLYLSSGHLASFIAPLDPLDDHFDTDIHVCELQIPIKIWRAQSLTPFTTFPHQGNDT